MNTAVLPNGVSYSIPLADMNFFKELVARMKWKIIDKTKKVVQPQPSSAVSWVDSFAGKWQDVRPTAQIIKDIHEARTSNSEISL